MRKIRQLNNFRVCAGMLHVIYPKLGKIASHNPTGTLGVGLLIGVTLGLLVRSEKSAVRLLDRLGEVFAEALLLDDDMGFRYTGVYKGGVTQLYLLFKEDKIFRLGYAVHIPKKGEPEGLCLAFLVALALSVGDKCLSCRLLLVLFHVLRLPVSSHIPSNST